MRGVCKKCRSFNRLYECGVCCHLYCYNCLQYHNCNFGLRSIFVVIIIFSILVIPNSVNGALTNCYDFDSNASDLIGSQNGIVTGATLNSSGKINGAYSFDGADASAGDYILLGNYSLIFNTSYTFAMWLYPKRSRNYDNPFHTDTTGNDCGYRLEQYTGNNLRIALSGECSYDEESIYTGGQFTPNSWYHFVLSYNGSKTKIYINGVNIINSTKSAPTNIINMTVGGSSFTASPSRHYYGLIDDVRFYNTVLTQSEVNSIYNGGSGTGCIAPTVTPDTVLINSDLGNTYNYKENTLRINYNATIGGQYSVFNCSLWDNKTLLNTTLNLNLNNTQNYFNYSVVNKEQDYYLKINCTNGVIYNNTNYFTYRVDNINPVGFFNTPLNNSLYVEGTNVQVTFNASDNNLFGVNFSILYKNGTSYYNVLYQNLTGGFYTNGTTVNLLKNSTARIKVWDSHTTKNITPINWEIVGDQIKIGEDLYIYGEGIKIYNNRGALVTYLSRNTDRYKFKVTFNDTTSFKTLYIKGSDLIPISSEYKGHFIYKLTYWIDFESSNIKKVTVTKLTDYYRLNIELNNASDEIETSSIGLLNSFETSINLNVIDQEDYNTQLLESINDNVIKIYGVIDMLPVISIWIILTILAFWLITHNQIFSGWVIAIMSIGFDFLISGILYDKYKDLVNVNSGFYGSMVAIFMFFLYVFVILKLIAYGGLTKIKKYGG